MQCLKCGREAGEGQVFCAECLEIMVENPVKPNTVVTIPERSVRLRIPKARKPSAAEEVIEQLERKILQLRLWICMLMAALVVCMGLLTWKILTEDAAPVIGQNYSSVTDFVGSGGGR